VSNAPADWFTRSVPPRSAFEELTFCVAEVATPTVIAATSNATPMLNMSRESTCFLRIKTPSIADPLALTSDPG